MELAESRHIKIEVADGAATITFNLPRYSNALDLLGVQETLHALYKIEADPDIGAVVLTGAGDAFCAGFNLREIPLASPGSAEIQAHFRELAMWWHQVLHLVVRMPKPVLAAVNGVAAGSGLGLVLASDLAVAREDARFLCAWHSIGIANDAATSYTLAKIVGLRRAMEMMITNRTVDAREALDWQLVNRVYAKASFAHNVRAIARELAAAPTHLQAMAKERFHMGWRQSIEECTEFEIQNVIESVGHPHFRKMLEGFVGRQRRSDMVQVRLP